MAKAPKAFIGLYLSNSRLEAAQYGADGTLIAYHAVIPDGDFLDDEGDITDMPRAIATLRAFWTEAKFEVKDVVLVPNTKKGIVRLLKLPRLPVDQLNQAILSEAEQFALFRAEEPLLDHFVAVPGSDFLQVCYAAIPRTVAERYKECVSGAGLKLVGLDLPQLAGQRGIVHFLPPEMEHWTGVQLLPGRLNVTFWLKEQLQAVREVQLPDWETVNIELLAQNYMPDVVRTIAREANVFLDDPHLVVGSENMGEARYLASYFKDISGIPVAVAGPDDWETAIEEGKPVPSYLVVGAAKWGAPGYVPSFDLVRKARRSIQNPFAGMGRKINLPMIGAAAACLVLALASFVTAKFMRADLDHQVNLVRGQIATINLDMQNQSALLAQTPPEEQLLKDWVPLHGENDFALAFLKEVRTIVPADAWLTEVKYENRKQLSFTGNSLKQSSGMVFAEALGRLPRVGQVKVVRLDRQDETYAFEIWAALQEPLEEVRP